MRKYIGLMAGLVIGASAVGFAGEAYSSYVSATTVKTSTDTTKKSKSTAVKDAATAVSKSTTKVSKTSTKTSETIKISADKAKEIALKKTNGGEVTKYELDREDGILVHEITVVNKNTRYSMDVNANDGTISDYKTKTIKKTTTQNQSETTSITEKKAKEIALKKTNGGKVTKYELDREDGVLVHEITVVNGNTKYTMDINANDGTITDYKEKSIKKDTTQSQSASVTEKEAKETALKKAGGGEVIKCKLDREDGKLIYEIKVINGNMEYSMDIDANNKKIYDYEEEQIDDVDNNSSNGAAISSDEAKKIALKKSGGGKVVKCELDYDDGMQVYEIEIINGNTEYEIDIDASNGTIIQFDSEIDD